MNSRVSGSRGGRVKRTSGGFPPSVKRRTRRKEVPSTSAAPSETTPDNPPTSGV